MSATMSSDVKSPVVESAPVAETVKRKTQVSATLSPESFDRLEDYRWTNRINKTSDIVAEAVSFFLDAKSADTKPAK